MSTSHVRVHRDADEELLAAASWYESERAGLGAEFLAAIDRTVGAITERPEIGSIQRSIGARDFRRVIVPRFPYQVVYCREAGEILVIAFAHLKRRPQYWKSRF